jgi:hypothetical protein
MKTINIIQGYPLYGISLSFYAIKMEISSNAESKHRFFCHLDTSLYMNLFLDNRKSLLAEKIFNKIILENYFRHSYNKRENIFPVTLVY